LKKILTLILCTTLFLGIIPLVNAVTVDENLFFEAGNETYGFNSTMNFSQIVVSDTWIKFNDTDFNISAPNDINITMVFLSDDISGAGNGDKVLEFYANTTGGNVWFNLSGFPVGRKYVVNRSDTQIAGSIVNISGYISFNNSIWSKKQFEILQEWSNNSPVLSNPSLGNLSTDVSISTSALSITIEDPEGDSFNWSIETSPNVGSNSGNNASNGSKSCSVSGLSYSTTYYWFVNATDGISWTNESYSFTTESEDTDGNGGNGGNGGGTPPPPVNNRPTADADGPYTGYVSQVITFNGTNSSDPNSDTLTYTWDFGDGNNGTGATPTHAYNSTGLYNVTLTVSDGSLTHSDTTTANITLDSDGDGYDDEMEDSYGTNATDPNEFPLDTDKDGIPDEDSEDGKYIGDTDDDNDGLDDEVEEILGSDPKDEADVTGIIIEETTHYLVDIDEDGQSNIFYNTITKNSTILGIRDDGKYLIDFDNDDMWDYIYDPVTQQITLYESCLLYTSPSPRD